MNKLSKSEVFAENKLFATLDTTVRKVVIKNLPFLLTDTVGFIRKLPHQFHRSLHNDLRITFCQKCLWWDFHTGKLKHWPMLADLIPLVARFAIG